MIVFAYYFCLYFLVPFFLKDFLGCYLQICVFFIDLLTFNNMNWPPLSTRSSSAFLAFKPQVLQSTPKISETYLEQQAQTSSTRANYYEHGHITHNHDVEEYIPCSKLNFMQTSTVEEHVPYP